MNNITQVNALVAKGSTTDASAVNTSLDDILKQLLVNRQHVDLFFSLYIKWLDRLFGEDVARAPEPATANSAWVKGSAGGWLKALASVSQPAGPEGFKLSQVSGHPLGRNINASYLDSLPYPLNDLLKKLNPSSSTFEVLSRIQGGCEIKLNMFPTKLQMYVADHPLYSYAQARYHSYLTMNLLRFALNSTNQRNHVVHKSALLLDATEYFFVCLLRYPTLSNAQVSLDRTSADSSSNGYSRGYYPTPSRASAVEVLQNRGVAQWIRGTPYLVLLQEYLREFLPVGASSDPSVALTSGTTPSQRDARPSTDYESQQQQRYRELFLHLAVAYWLDTVLVLKSDHYKLGVLRKQLAGAAVGYGDVAGANSFLVERPHPAPTEIELLDATSLRSTIGTMQATYLLLLRVLADPQLLRQVDAVCDYGDALGLTHGTARRTPSSLSRAVGGAGGGAQPAWLLIQAPLFDTLRAVFVKGDASGLDPQVVWLAVEVWLLWLQPWNALTLLNSSTGVLPTRTSQAATVGPEWHAYIAANLHFYTTLLACFVKFISRGQLSVTDADGSRLLAVLERVQQVFTPPLVNIVNELVVGFQDWYIPQHSLRHDAQGVHRMQDTLLMRATLRGTPSAVPAHLRRTPRTEGYAPGPGADSPTSASRLNDGADEGDGSGRREVPKQLLHLMQLQHVRLFPDRRIDELEDCGITDLAVHAEEAGTGIVSQLQQMNQHPVVEQDAISRMMSKVVAGARAQLGLPPEQPPRSRHHDRLERAMGRVIEWIPNAAAGRVAVIGGAGGATGSHRSGRSGFTAETVRDPNSGHLTDYGRQRILEGRDKCRVQDLLEPRALARDPLELPHCSYEWKGLAQLLIAVSKHLNDRFQLPEDNQYLMCSWATVLRRARQAQPRGDHLYPLKIARSCFRFNLRFLASYRAFSATMIVILLASYRLGLAPLSVVFLLCSAFFYVAYENGIRIE